MVIQSVHAHVDIPPNVTPRKFQRAAIWRKTAKAAIKDAKKHGAVQFVKPDMPKAVDVVWYLALANVQARCVISFQSFPIPGFVGFVVVEWEA